MTDSPFRHYWRPVFEITTWCLPVAGFLYAYVVHYGNPASVIPAHLFLVASVFAGGIGLRAIASTVFERQAFLPYVSATLALLPWLLLLFWYSLALVGLAAWGRVTTWPIFRAYASQYPYLFETLGYPSWLIWIPPAVLVVAIYCIARSPFVHTDWPGLLYHKNPRNKAHTLALILVVLPVLLFGMIHTQEPLHPLEPIEFSLYPQLGEQQESTAFPTSPALNAAEASARQQFTPNAPQHKRNVILIVGDALRADHLQAYGYNRPTTPNLVAMAKTGELQIIPEMRSVCAESVCGYMALASSRPIQYFPQQPITLHETLHRSGYAVRLILSGDHTNFYGLRKFYGKVDSYFDGSNQPIRWAGPDNSYVRYINDDEIVIDQIKKLPASLGQKPLFLQVVLMSTHGLGPRHPEYTKFSPSINYYKWFSKKIPDLSRSEQQAAINYYDNGVVQFDHYVNIILQQLKNKGYLEDAVVVITGDHGEMLSEGNIYSHGVGVREPVLRIPMLMARFGYQAATLPKHAIASQIDIAPTILHEIGITPPSTWRGIPLQTATDNRSIYFQQAAEAGFYQSNNISVIKYWYDFKKSQDFVFNLKNDPHETYNLAKETSAGQLAKWRIKVAHGGLQIGETHQFNIAFPIFKPSNSPHTPTPPPSSSEKHRAKSPQTKAL